MWKYNHTPDSNDLMHYGILGQKWGRRRYQFKDGSLTAAGRKRYDDDDSERASAKAAKYEYKAAKSRAKNITNKYDRKAAIYEAKAKRIAKKEEADYDDDVEKASERATKDRNKTIRRVAIGAGIAVAAFAAYKISKSGSAEVGRDSVSEILSRDKLTKTKGLGDSGSSIKGKAFVGKAFRSKDTLTSPVSKYSDKLTSPVSRYSDKLKAPKIKTSNTGKRSVSSILSSKLSRGAVKSYDPKPTRDFNKAMDALKDVKLQTFSGTSKIPGSSAVALLTAAKK